MIKIQKNDFNIEKEISSLKSKFNKVGSVSIFVGYVRNENNNKNVESIDLEYGSINFTTQIIHVTRTLSKI